MKDQRTSEDQNLTITLNFLEPYFKVYEYTQSRDTFTLYGIPKRDDEIIRTSLHNPFMSHGIQQI